MRLAGFLTSILSLTLLAVAMATAPAVAASKEEALTTIVGRELKKRVASCWYLPYADMPVVAPAIRFELDRQGALTSAEVANHSEDAAFQRIAESALQAVRKCGASPELSAYADQYDLWREVIMNFDAGEDAQQRQPWKNKASTSATLRRSAVIDGKTVVVLTLSTRSFDGRKVETRLVCPADRSSRDLSIGIDFGTPLDKATPQSVAMMFEQTTDRRDYRPQGRYLVADGPDAAAQIKDLSQARRYLEFSGPGGVSALFDLDTVRSKFSQFSKLCGILG